jgi:predicted RNase H-like HicB family nuclease
VKASVKAYMKRYPINIFYSEEDHGYIANIPDLEMCSAFGKTPEIALQEVLIAQQAWLETALKHGKPIPEPKGTANQKAS